MRSQKLALLAACTSALAFGEAAHAAVPPTLLSVGHQDRHPTATFVAGGTDFATIYVATKPERATDGHFFSENVIEIDLLEKEETQAGRWVHRDALKPGTYYLMLRVIGLDCFDNPNCIDGSSNVMELTIANAAPTLSFLSLGFTTIVPRYGDGYVRVAARFRVCDDLAGSMSVFVEEGRVRGGRLRVRSRWSRPVDAHSPCAVRTLRWQLARKFLPPGLGSYVVTLRVRDADGGLSKRASKIGFVS